MRQYENLWKRVITDFKQNAKTIIEEVNQTQAKTTAKAVRKEKLRDEDNWKVGFYYELFADYDSEKFELTLELRPRRGRTIDGDNLRRIL